MSGRPQGTRPALWGGRFAAGPHALLEEFGRSVDVDARLLPYDLVASRAWADELHRCGVLDDDSHSRIDAGLVRMIEECSPADVSGSSLEDVHTWIETELGERIGEAAGRLHTGRSRNDQVMTATRMYAREACDALVSQISNLATELLELAERAGDAVVPAYTHMQRAQPMLFAHWCLAWVTGFERDAERMTQSRARIDVLPLGSGACVGTSVPVDRDRLATRLGFSAASRNSIDAVADRDCFIDVVSACAQIMARLSRLAEDMLLYSGREYAFITVDDAVTTGSSLLPHKRNLDPMELVRGKAGRVFGHLQSLLVMSKGVPSAYARDLQEDKPALFDALDTTRMSVAMTARVIAGTQVRADATRAAADHGFLEAMELADHLVDAGVGFRTAHRQVGALVQMAEAQGVELRDLSLEEIREAAPDAGDDVHAALTIDRALGRRDVIGGTAPARVEAALAAARERLVSNVM